MIAKVGDTLSHIAQRDYGIYEAKRDKPSIPDLLDPGPELLIPESR